MKRRCKIAWVWLALSATAGGVRADMNVSTEYSWPTRWSTPVVGPNGLIVPPVPVSFDRVSVGTHLQTPNPTVNYNPQTPLPDSPMLRAASTGDVQTVKQLLAKGAAINAPNSHGDTALMKAAAAGQAAMVELLLANGAEVNDANRDGQTALVQATRRGQTKVVQVLLEHQADPVVLDESGKMALDYAVAGTNATIVVLLKAATR